MHGICEVCFLRESCLMNFNSLSVSRNFIGVKKIPDICVVCGGAVFCPLVIVVSWYW